MKFHGTPVWLYAVVLLYAVAGRNSITAIMSCQQLRLHLVVHKLSFKIGAPETKHSDPQWDGLYCTPSALYNFRACVHI